MRSCAPLRLCEKLLKYLFDEISALNSVSGCSLNNHVVDLRYYEFIWQRSSANILATILNGEKKKKRAKEKFCVKLSCVEAYLLFSLKIIVNIISSEEN